MQGGSRPVAGVVHRPLVLPDWLAWSGAVLLPWALSRGALLLLAASAARQRGKTFLAGYAVWDGGWYTRIARDGYAFVTDRGETPYPFFPLFPGVLHAGERLGAPAAATGLVVNHLVLLLALTGVWAIAAAHGSRREAALAAWSLALYPGSASLALLYPCAILLACSVWAFLALERDRDALAALLAAVAALARPNGLVLAASLAATVLLAGGAWRRALRLALPAVAVVAAWVAWLWVRTGDALVFLHAKAAWHEVSLASLLEGKDRLPKIDLAPAGVALVVLLLAGRRLPLGWLVLVALALLPSLGLGILGMPRYVAACFPVFVACGIVLARLPLAVRVAVLASSALGLVALGRRVLLGVHMP